MSVNPTATPLPKHNCKIYQTLPASLPCRQLLYTGSNTIMILPFSLSIKIFLNQLFGCWRLFIKTTSLFSGHNTFNQHKCSRIEKVTASALSLLESQAFCAKCVHSFFESSATFRCTSPTGTNHSYSSSCPICCRLGLKSDGWM